MQSSQPSREPTVQRYRPSSVSVFAAAFVAGAVVAFGLNRMLDTHMAQSRPQVESVPIFVALRSLPQGAPVTVWDVALRDWPKAMLPTTALGAEDSFEGMVLKHPLREGQPLLSVQLMRSEAQATADSRPGEVFAAPAPAAAAAIRKPSQPEPDLWTPAASPTAEVVAPQPAVAAIEAPQQPVQPVPQPVEEPQPAEQLPTVAIAATPVEDAPAVAVADPAPVTVPSAVDLPTEPEASTLVSDEVSEAVIEDAPAQPTLAESVPPVPASPLIDIEQTLKAVSNRSPAFTEAPYAGPTVAESVLTTGPTVAATPSDSASSDNASAPLPLRYLVVPERIAVEADASFAAPPPAVTPPVAAMPRSPQAAAKQPAPKQPQGQKTAATPQSQRPLGAFFPNMAAGLDALGGSRSGQPPQPTRSR
jgi:nicotinate-nucleotide--dimethylbenzimidazole phosphoribosyltransferase